MAGYWSSSFLRVYTEVNLVHKHSKKKERGQYPAILTEQAYLLYGKKTHYFLAGHSGYSRAVNIALSCPFEQPITAQDLVHLARSRSWPCFLSCFFFSARRACSHEYKQTLYITNVFLQKLLQPSSIQISYIQFASSVILALKETDVFTVDACL